MSWHQIANEKDFGEALEFAATLIPLKKVRIALLGDGAPWLWKHMSPIFPDGKEILDYYHCSEHIHKFAEIQYAGDTDKQAIWIESTIARLNVLVQDLHQIIPDTHRGKKLFTITVI